MKSKRRIFFCAGAVIILLALAAAIMVIGRGHTLYFDNVALEYEGQTYESPYKVKVEVKGEQVANLHAKDRGTSIWIGQNFKMMVDVTEEKGGQEQRYAVNLKLPYNMDGIIINIPAVMAGLPPEAWCSEFIQMIVEEDVEDPAGTEDEFGIGGDLGGDLGGDMGM